MLTRPILFSNDLSQCYSEISSEDLKNLIESRLKTFNEEELNVQLIVFQELLEHITRISRVLQQPLGHLLLGKTRLLLELFSIYKICNRQLY
jgi:dynein heavy chain 1, cytosolic